MPLTSLSRSLTVIVGPGLRSVIHRDDDDYMECDWLSLMVGQDFQDIFFFSGQLYTCGTVLTFCSGHGSNSWGIFIEVEPLVFTGHPCRCLFCWINTHELDHPTTITTVLLLYIFLITMRHVLSICFSHLATALTSCYNHLLIMYI